MTLHLIPVPLRRRDRICTLSCQAEAGIRDADVTGVQTCALPIQAEDGIRDAEEHTSELQSRPHLVCRLLLGKQKSTSLNSSNVRISYDVLCFQKNALQK